jgi:hypothetical protein
MLRIVPPLVVAVAVCAAGCSPVGGLPCGYDLQTELIIHTLDASETPVSATSVTCQVGGGGEDDGDGGGAVSEGRREPLHAWCLDDACTVWRCTGLVGRVTVIASAGTSEGTTEVLVTKGPCDGTRPEIGVILSGG